MGSHRGLLAGRMRRFTVLAAASMSMLLAICVAVALATEADQKKTISVLSEPPRIPAGEELESKRTATSQTFLLPSGAMETRIFASPIHYRDNTGEWKPIDDLGDSLGSGFVIASDGATSRLITNFHVIAGASEQDCGECDLRQCERHTDAMAGRA